jgi:ABC-type molybdate transport system substrate-binding protein
VNQFIREKNQMKVKLFMCMAVLAMLFTAASSFATVTCDYTATKGANPSASSLTIAAAANFYKPVIDLVGTASPASGFLGQASVNNITVCIVKGATADLRAAIIANPTDYDFFFAANNTATNLPSPTFTYSPFLYANGVPVLFGFVSAPAPATHPATVTNFITNVGDLITGIGSTDHVTVSKSGAALTALNYQIDANAQNVATANPSTAPYGLAACKVLGDMGYYSSTACPPFPAGTPAWVDASYTDIDNAYQAVGVGSVTSGFVSRTQICQNIADSDVAYIDFSGYALAQNAVQITAEGDDLYDYIQDQMDTISGTSTLWNVFLNSNCYGTI